MDARHRFCIRKIASKMQILQVCLPLKEPLVALLNETCALTSETNVAKKVWPFRIYQTQLDYFAQIQKGGVLPKGFQYFWSI